MEDKMTREKAYEILGLEPDAPLDRVKIKYENYMRRAKFDETFDEETITRAYDTIMGIDWGNFEPDEAYTKKGINKKKIENFFYHYKRGGLYLLGVTVVIVSVILLIVVGRTSYDYTITLIGSLNIKDQEVMTTYYEELLDVEDVLVDYIMINANSADGSLTEEGMYRLMGDLQGGESDLYIVSAEFAKFLSYDGALRDLTPHFSQIGIQREDENILYWYREGTGEIAAAYKFGNKSIFTKGITGRVPEYFCIPHRAEFTEMTEIVIKDLIEQNK